MPTITQVAAALRAWVKSASGLGDEYVFFADQKVPRPATTYVTLRADSLIPLGLSDEVTRHTDLGRPVGTEVEHRVEGVREAPFSIQVWAAPASTGPTADTTAVGLANKISTSLGLPAIAEALDAAGVSVFDVGPVQNLGALLGTDFDGRAQFNCRCYFRGTLSGYTGYIADAEMIGVGGATVIVNT